MNKYTKAYLNIISEMNDQTIQNLSQNITFDQTKYDELCKGQHFLQNPHEYSSSRYSHSGYTNYDECIQGIELSNNKSVTVEYEAEIYYSVDPGQNGGWTDPSWDPYLEEAYIETESFYKDLNNPENDEIFTITDDETGEQIKFSQLSLYDRYLIVKAIIQYHNSSKWFDQNGDTIWNQLLEAEAEAKAERYMDRYDDRY